MRAKKSQRVLIAISILLMGLVPGACRPTPRLPVDLLPAGPTVSPAPTSTLSPTRTAIIPETGSSTPTKTPTPTPEPPVRFAVIGDYGMDNQAEADVAALILGWEVDFVITTGDNNYPDGETSTIDANIGKYFHSFIYPYYGEYGVGADTNRFFPSPGNHDWRSDGGQPYQDYFTLPGNERYYDFIWGPVHFFAVNSDSREPDGIGRSSKQAAWLKEAMSASTAPWQIVYTHYSPYSSARHGSNLALQWPFAEWGADAVLSGHDHTYERLLVGGLPYFVNGLGGAGRYWFNDPVPGSQMRYNGDHGAMLVVATQAEIVFEFINRRGELIDRYVVRKP